MVARSDHQLLNSPDMKEPLLSVQDVGYSVGEGAAARVILRNVTLTLNRGDRLAIVGPNGCGKSSLLRRIASDSTLAGEQTGNIRIGGSGNAVVSFVRQHPKLFPWLRVSDNVGFAEDKGDVGSKDALIARLACSTLKNRFPANLSGGELQRVALAQALFPHPDLLLLDESVSAMDQGHKRQVMETLAQECCERAMGLIFVTHDVRDVLVFANRVLVLSPDEAGTATASEIALPSGGAVDSPESKQAIVAITLAMSGGILPRNKQK